MAKLSLRADAGYGLIDHRASPGTTDVPEGTIYEADLICCTHCGLTMFFNPMRTRERGYCPKCDHYICDTCNAIYQRTFICHPMTELIWATGYGKLEEVLEKRRQELAPFGLKPKFGG